MEEVLVSVRRQDGTAAVFNAQLNEVRENGAVILSVSGTADLIFSPTSNDLMLPAEIVAALLDVIVRRDQSRPVGSCGWAGREQWSEPLWAWRASDPELIGQGLARPPSGEEVCLKF